MRLKSKIISEISVLSLKRNRVLFTEMGNPQKNRFAGGMEVQNFVFTGY